MKDNLKTIILAAGQGTRMKSDLAKVLHKINDQELIKYVLDLVKKIGTTKTYLIIGHQAQKVKQATLNYDVDYVLQKEQLGTGHAVTMVEKHLSDHDGNSLILCGDVPLLTEKTINDLLTEHQNKKAVATILTMQPDDPKSYGRIIRNSEGLVTKIVEYKDATDEERKCREVNSGIYCFNTKELFKALKEVNCENKQKEYYLTDVIEILEKQNKRVAAWLAGNQIEVHGINDLEDLTRAEEYLRS